MKRITKWKQLVILIILLILSTRLSYIWIHNEVDKKYFTSATINIENLKEIPCKNLVQTFTSDKTRLNSIELVFSNISNDKIGTITLKILYEDEVLYQTNLSLANLNNNEWKKIYVNCPLSSNNKYQIFLTSSDTCTQIPNVLLADKKNSSPESLSSYSDGNILNKEIAIQYGYLQFPNIFDKLMASSLYIILSFTSIIILIYYERLSKKLKQYFNKKFGTINKDILYPISMLLGSLIIISYSGIIFQDSVKILLYFISIYSAIGFEVKQNTVTIICNNRTKKAVLYFLYLYAAFALVGQRIFIYPLNKDVTITDLFVFFITFLWMIPVIQTFLCFIEKISTSSFSNQTKLNKVVFLALTVTFLLVPALYCLFAYNPGISTPDTYDCMITNAHHIHGMLDWHPAFYCIILKIILSIWDSTYCIILVHYFFWVYVMEELLLYLRKKGIKDSLLILISIFSGGNAANFMHLNTIWKDIPYALSLLWVLIILAKLSIDYEEYKKNWYIYLEMFIALIGIFLFRKNGVVSFIVIATITGTILYKNTKVWATLLITIITIFVIKGPFYNLLEIQDSGKTGMYIALSQDILGAYYSGGEVSEDTLQMINVMTSYNNAEFTYTPTWSYQSYSLNVEPQDFIFNYIDTFIKNPLLMSRAIIAREDALWNIFAGQDAVLREVNNNITMDGNGIWNVYYPERKYTSLYTKMLNFTSYTANSQWLSAIEWRSGLFTLLGILTITFTILKNGIKKYVVILSPLLGHILSLLLSTGWSDFRYFWPVNLMNLAIIFLMLLVIKNH